MLNLYIGYVADVNDNLHAERVKAVISKDKSPSDIPWASPLIPKMLHVKPKVNEAVLVFVENDGQANAKRYYVGPIISQPQNMFFDDFFSYSATKTLGGGVGKKLTSIDNIPDAIGTFPENDEIAVIGRKNSEIILGDNDVRIRAGVRKTNPVTEKISEDAGTVNARISPAFIKVCTYEQPLITEPKIGERNAHTSTNSTATIYADKINLISPNGDGSFELSGKGESISDKKMKDIIERAHKLPYGDVLCDFFSLFLKMYMNHSHPYPGMPPLNADPDSAIFWEKYNSDKNSLEDKLLSKDIRIN